MLWRLGIRRHRGRNPSHATETDSHSGLTNASMKAREQGVGRLPTLTRASDLDRAFRHGRRLRSQPLLVITVRREEGGARLAFLTAKDVGTAVARNRVKRRLREACRELWPRLADRPYDVLLMGLPAALRCEFRSLVSAMEGLLRKAGVLAAGPRAGP